jgi:hypothetical protein
VKADKKREQAAADGKGKDQKNGFYYRQNSHSVRNKSIALYKAISRTGSFFIASELLRFKIPKIRFHFSTVFQYFRLLSLKGFGHWTLFLTLKSNKVKILLFISTLVTSLQ